MNHRRAITLLALCWLLLPGLGRAADKDKDNKAKEAAPGVDTSKMTQSERTHLKEMTDKFPSPCGKAHSLSTSLKSDPKCRRSQLAVRALQKWLTDGYLPSEVEELYEARFGKKVFEIDVAGGAVRGDPKAKVALVEFSDFECPHCKMAEPMIKQILAENPQVKLIFFNYPLPMHQNAGPAAAAALAAGKQGKFWAYHDKLFENQGKLNPAELIQYAQELKLDIPRFQADMDAARARVLEERKRGEKLDIQGTPSFYINGRKFNDKLTVDNLRAWIDEELAR